MNGISNFWYSGVQLYSQKGPMHPLVQSAVEAAQQNDKNKAMAFLKQALTANPNDIEAMLVLVNVLDQPDQKRQILSRVLTLEPMNKTAREEMLKLDRMAMRTFQSDASVAAVMHRPTTLPSSSASPRKPTPQAPNASEGSASSQPQAQSPRASKPSITQPVMVKNTFTKWNWVEESPTVKPQVAVELDSSLITEKPLVFKYPFFWRILVYFFVALFGCVGLLSASQSVVNSLPFLALAGLMGLIALVFSPTVEISDAGIRASGIFSSAEIRWDEIATLKSAPLRGRLELSSKTGRVVNVSTQVSGYSRIVQLIRQRRPDLFGAAPAPVSRAISHSSYASPFRETKAFHKSFLNQYGILFIVLPLFFFAVWMAMTEPTNRVGAFIAAAFCGIMIFLPFFQVSSIKVESDKLTIETLFEQRILTAREIKEIKMQSVRGRYGRVTNYVNIILVTGRNYPLQGFADGDEIIYGTLLNWWESHRDQ